MTKPAVSAIFQVEIGYEVNYEVRVVEGRCTYALSVRNIITASKVSILNFTPTRITRFFLAPHVKPMDKVHQIMWHFGRGSGLKKATSKPKISR